ncbi:MAG TPA: hypothetical protein VKF36_21350 [Syntrophorhabdales bacterium]|nr:hypothetical protein [Syntrophorhabdales bacterium]
MKCPGQDTRYWKPGDIFETPCPHCGHAVEFFKDESTRKCRQCHRLVTNPRMDFGCAAYCKYAEQCLGELSPDLLSKRKDLLKDRVALEMKKYFRQDFKSINHAIRVARYAEQIGGAMDSHEKTGGNPATEQKADLAILLSASYLHGIACPEKESDGPSFGAVCGGVGSVGTLLEGLGAAEELVEKVLETIKALGQDNKQVGENGFLRNAQILRDAHVIAELQERQEQAGADNNLDRIAISELVETEEGRIIAGKILLRE